MTVARADDPFWVYEYGPGHLGTCVARWATASDDHTAGSICGRESVFAADDVTLCRHHSGRMKDWAIGAVRDWRERLADAEMERECERRSRAAKGRRYWVYFLHRCGWIKIGSSFRLPDRIAAIEKGSVAMPPGVGAGPVDLIGRIRGYQPEEVALHRRFQAYRFPQTEWFRPEGELADYLREQFEWSTAEVVSGVAA